jgi:hypothetical protein
VRIVEVLGAEVVVDRWAVGGTVFAGRLDPG